ncbi:hypothetical protein FYJ24_06970 [Actinomycetaceae bacterium WB03_NA08]|uniref:Uncharacterized protein n=1 Tax=Scrofimicrobium canadense TaxID=2652290 RepID=A0A6N7VRV4_9ACTO|nr:hypothetical protein [Scrofimicrobium canadense]MSS84509.1 hypothetical protein [Scrofimicrobium canadense]
MSCDDRDQRLVELVAGLECTSLKRRAGLRGGQVVPETYPVDFLHCLPEAVQSQYRERAREIIKEARMLGPANPEEITPEIATKAPYDKWVLLEARVALNALEGK